METPAIQQLHDLVLKGAPVCTDSRTARPGAIFIALKGDTFNGNRFAAQALDKGCRLAVIDEPAAKADERYLLVEDALATLQALSLKHRRRFHMPVIAITGSNGKTTTKELLHAALATGLRTLATSGNLNNHIGVPLTLLQMKEPLDVAIVEMGANHVGEIGALCRLARPTHGLITNIGKAHLEGFGTPENVVKAKSELYHFLRETGGTVFVNGDNPLLTGLTEGMTRVLYGTGGQNHLQGQAEKSFPTLDVSFRTLQPFGAAVPGIAGSLSTRLTGAYNLENMLAAVAAGLYFGRDSQGIAGAMAEYEPRNHRSQLLHTARNMVVMDAYNANPTSMRAALDNFRHFTDGPTALLLGDMLELGAVSMEEHLNIIALAQEGGYSKIVLVGPAFVRAWDAWQGKRDTPCLAFRDAATAAGHLSAHPLTGYRILVKGSRGIRMEALLPSL
jgi:UDP-N-acetylmuramoyl-tripeptide--D-alanyl-D-alanine ligase